MGLRDVRYREDYRSGHDNILEDFFRPSLGNAKEYWRAVGYFSSSSLESFGTPLGEFLKNDGHIRLITSVELSEADLNAISEGISRQTVCMRRLEEIIEEEFADGVGNGVTRLGRLLEMERLEIRIAMPKSGTGIYHEKIGVFFDDNDCVAFSGSSNESRRAYENNRECIDVYTSWNSASRAERKRLHFESVWNCTDKGVEVFEFSDAVRRKLVTACRERGKDKIRYGKDERWRHQEEAVQEFVEVERGVLNMATGTGKTRTALKIMGSLRENGEIDTVIISTDGNDLLDQWYVEMLGIRKDMGVKVYRHYKSTREIEDSLLAPRNGILLTSRQPLASALRGLPSEIGSRTLLVHDEVHGLGSPANRARLHGLSEGIRFRLGLSATPEREYDDEGNRFILEHIGPEIFRFELDDAIRRRILAPFNYFPLPYELTVEDRQRVRDVYKRQAARKAEGNPMSDEEVWIDIARVYKTSKAKLPVFDEFIHENRQLLKRCIVFVETQSMAMRSWRLFIKLGRTFIPIFQAKNRRH